MAFVFRNAADASPGGRVDDQIEQGERLKQSHPGTGSLFSDTVYDVRLEPKLLRVNPNDDRSFPELDVIQYDSSRLY